VLLAGLRREEELQGEAWGAELVCRYWEALDRFEAPYGIGRAWRERF
jgi:hypothetical protein